MYQGKTFLGIIPARGGSKGIPRKNIKILADKPLISWTIEEALKSTFLDRVILSSEDNEIIEVAKKYDCDIPFIRPKELAMDDTPAIDVVLHALGAIEEKYDFIVLLQPTSPIRKAFHIDEAISFLIKNESQSLVSVCEVKKSPFWMFTIDRHNNLKPIFESNIPLRRQDSPQIYILNGAIYIASPSFLNINKTFLDKETISFIMDAKASFDIDDELDWTICQTIINDAALEQH